LEAFKGFGAEFFVGRLLLSDVSAETRMTTMARTNTRKAVKTKASLSLTYALNHGDRAGRCSPAASGD